MRIQRSVCVLLLLFTGCVQQHPSETAQKASPMITQAPMPAVSRSDQQNNYEITADPNTVLSMRQVLALTLIHNPELKVFSLETRAAAARQLQAGLWPNPEIDIETENIGGTGELSGFDGAETTIQLSQLIEMGNKSQKRRRVASLEKELADLNFQHKKLEVFSEAAKGFIGVLQAQEKVQLSNELLKLSEESFQIVVKRVEAGKDSPLEKTRASIVLENMKIANSRVNRDLDYANKRLASFWGQDKLQFKEVLGDLYAIEQLASFEEMTHQLEQSPEYLRWQTEIRKNQAMVDLEDSRKIGDITVGAGLRRFNETDDNAFVFGVSIPLPVSDRNQGAKQEAVYNLAKSREMQRTAWFNLQNQLNEKYQDLINAYSQAVSLKNSVLPATIKMFDASRRAYQEGKVDYLNVLDAQRTLFDIKNEYIESLTQYHIAKAEIERFISRNVESVTISESEH